MNSRPLSRLLLLALAIPACSDSSGPTGETPPLDLALGVQEIATGLSNPLYLASPTDDSRLFVVEQPGRIRIIKNGQLLATPFLDITSRVSSGGERGLLSVAFHPSYATNGFIYVNFTDLAGNTRVERFTVSSNADVANAASSKLILTQTQPFANHNGGLNLFGPDGMLYIGLGDGGSGGDPFGNGQNLGTLLGKILRIDVDHGDPYAIPADNPFVTRAGARGEIWAYGLRNPWRFAFDRLAGLLYVADVGQDRFEEVNVVVSSRSGVNYGWNVMEGQSCYTTSSCSQTNLEIPPLVYDHASGCSIIGGYVYRGTVITPLVGRYFYSDYCNGFLKSFRYENGQALEQKTWDIGSIGNVTSFGQDAAGELYITTATGKVYKIIRTG
ncbi:MAG TPA: PQQ-dependent sugar dehydrogenase [Gemmatimonadaceae bacterium]|jgi:glucose/arabinose dehydrogenase|nr:PQQ-dependent sugar dehydrogenase [Gemmatimonadaceae bacterium]